MDTREIVAAMAKDIEPTFAKLIASKTNYVPSETMEKIAIFVSKYNLCTRMILSEGFPPLSWSPLDATVNMEIAMECYGMARAVVRHCSRILRACERMTSQQVESPYEGVYLPAKPQPAGMLPFESPVHEEFSRSGGKEYTPLKPEWENVKF